MKSINHAINGLASSLLLNIGLTSVAEKFDTVAQHNTSIIITQGAAASEICDCCLLYTSDAADE